MIYEVNWGEWLKNNAYLVESLIPKSVDNFEDLAFLKEVLKDKRIVMLGESSHGAAEFITAKTRLVQYLHQKLGFNVLMFESGLGETHSSNLLMNSSASEDIIKKAIISVWHTKEIVNLFDYLKNHRDISNPLHLSGLDLQPNGSYGQFLKLWFERVDLAIAQMAHELEMQFEKCFQRSDIAQFLVDKVKMIEDYNKLIQFVEKNGPELAAVYPEDARLIQVTLHVLQGRIKTIDEFLEQAVLGNKYASENNMEKGQKHFDQITVMRDQRMAEELIWLCENLYSDEKIIIWSHNYHVRKDNTKVKNNRTPLPTMTGLLPHHLKKESYVIGLYMNRGVSSFVDRNPMQVRYPHPENSLESILSKSEFVNQFVDLAGHNYSKETSWMFNEIIALDWGTWDELLVPNEQYDGILLIDEVNIPNYIG